MYVFCTIFLVHRTYSQGTVRHGQFLMLLVLYRFKDKTSVVDSITLQKF